MIKTSITAKLLFAFGAIAVLAMVAAGVGIVGFQRIATTQNSVINQAIPVLQDAHALAAINERVSASAQRLLDSDDVSQYEAASQSLKQHVVEFKSAIDLLENQAFAAQYRNTIDVQFNRINRILGDQNDLIASRLSVDGQMAMLVERLISNTVALNQLADSLVANAAATTTAVMSNLYDAVEEGASKLQLYNAFDRLIEVDVDSMERMFELRLRSSHLSAIVNSVAKETDQETLNSLKAKTNEVVSILERRVNEINDPQRKLKALTLLRSMRLDSGPLNTVNLFRLREKQLELATSIADLDRQYRIEASKMNGVVSNLSGSSGSVVSDATRRAESSLNESRRAFIFITILALLLMLFILWRYVHFNVIRRLQSLKQATLAISQGNLEHSVKREGADELTAMTDALLLFRDNAREKRRLNEELQNYKKNLEKTVNHRTNQLKASNEKLEREVAEHTIARQKAEQANRAKTDFLATISHELRTPLSGALGTLSLLRGTGLTPKQREYLDAVDTANSVLLDILDNVLGYSQVRAGQIDVDQSRFNLHGLMENVVDVMGAAARQANNEIDLEIDPNVPVWLNGDSGKLNQILLNLIGNAVKFTHEGMITVTVRKVDFGDAHTKIQFEVIDTGIGVSEEKREEIFNAFTQGDASTSRRYGGIGLGLAICKSLVDLLGGSINLYSIKGEGTTVSLMLDFNEPTELLTNQPTQMHSQHPPMTVMLVEDDQTNRLVVRHYLESMGHEVMIAEDGDIAIELLNQYAVDLVLLDISLPGTDGMTVVKEIRQSEVAADQPLPVIAMSAHVFHEEVKRYLKAGMNGFIGKPFTREDLSLIISQTLGQGRARSLVREEGEDGPWNASQLVDHESVVEDLSILGAQKIKELEAQYIRQFEVDCQALKEAWEKGDISLMNRIAHKMKSAAGSMGLKALRAFLDDVEQGRRTGSRVIDELVAINNQSIEAFSIAVGSATDSQKT